MRALVIAFIAVALCVASANAAAAKCHNITGTCFEHGFQCANDEIVPHSKRCNGVEDCADGTDEFMCTHDDPTPLAERSDAERHAVMQATCVKCTCAVATLTIGTGSGWFQYANRAPTDFAGLMTGSGPYKGLACNPNCAGNMLIAFYKKYKVCRGWLCCARQRECLTCTTSNAGCSAVVASSRCYSN